MSLPPRLMKYWIIRMPDPIPFGLTFLLAMILATDLASFLKVPSGGKVDTVFTPLTQRLLAPFLWLFLAAFFLPAFFFAAFFFAIRQSPSSRGAESGSIALQVRCQAGASAICASRLWLGRMGNAISREVLPMNVRDL